MFIFIISSKSHRSNSLFSDIFKVIKPLTPAAGASYGDHVCILKNSDGTNCAHVFKLSAGGETKTSRGCEHLKRCHPDHPIAQKYIRSATAATSLMQMSMFDAASSQNAESFELKTVKLVTMSTHALPLSFVLDPHFRALFPPDKTVSVPRLKAGILARESNMFTMLREIIVEGRKLMGGNKFIQLVTDGMTNRNKSGYLAIAIRFHDPFANRRSILVSVGYVPKKSNSGEDMARQVQQLFRTRLGFEAAELLVSCIQDGAAMTIADSLNLPRQRCLMHLIDLFAERALGNNPRAVTYDDEEDRGGRSGMDKGEARKSVVVLPLMSKINEGVKTYSSSKKETMDSVYRVIEVRHLDVPKIRIIAGNDTRMMSSHDTLLSIIRLSPAFNNMPDSPLKFAEVEFQGLLEIEAIMNFLKSMQRTTENENNALACYSWLIIKDIAKKAEGNQFMVIDEAELSAAKPAPSRTLRQIVTPAGKECLKLLLMEIQWIVVGLKDFKSLVTTTAVANEDGLAYHLTKSEYDDNLVDYDVSKTSVFVTSENVFPSREEGHKCLLDPRTIGSVGSAIKDSKECGLESLVDTAIEFEKNRASFTARQSVDATGVQASSSGALTPIVVNLGEQFGDMTGLTTDTAWDDDSDHEAENTRDKHRRQFFAYKQAVGMTIPPGTDAKDLDVESKFHEMIKKDSTGTEFGVFPQLALRSCGELLSESYAERMGSAGNLVMSAERTSLDDKMFESLILLRMNRDFFEYGEELVKNNVIQCDFSQVMDIEVNEESDDGDNSGNSTSKRRKLDGNNAVKNVDSSTIS